MVPHRFTVEEARRIAVRAQLLDARRAGDVIEVAEQTGGIKIDPTATIAPAEHTALWTRIGYPYEPGQLKKAVEVDRLLVELDGEYRPVGALPSYLPALRRWADRDRNRSWIEANDRFRGDVLDRLRAEGPLTAADIPDTAQVARAPDSWSGPNQVPRMLEMLSWRGEVAIAGRRGRNRVWDLAERVYPALPALGEEEGKAGLRALRLKAAGIVKHSQYSPVGDAGEPATIDGLPGNWRVDPEALTILDQGFEPRVAFLNPYDRMLWDRPRLDALFGFHYVLEQFKPKDQRRYGFFAHPVLVGDRFAAMLEAEVDRAVHLLHVRQVHELEPLDADELEAIRAEVLELAAWLQVGLSESSAV